MSFKQFLKENNKGVSVYFDMDGTIADFIGTAIEHNPDWSEQQLEGQTMSDDEFWPKILKIPNFWESLKPISNGMQMLKYASDNGYNVNILTAHSSHDKRSIPGKKVWIKKYLSNFNINNVYFEKQKGKHADENSLLVDDLDKNLKEFKAEGGHVLKFKQGKTTLAEFKKALSKIKPLTEDVEVLTEKQILYNNGSKYGQIVFLAGGAGCFDGDTLVKTEEGYEKIKDVKEGTLVLTFNEETKENEYKPVQKQLIFEEHTEKLLELKFDNGETVVCTENHEFYIDGEWVKAKDL